MTHLPNFPERFVNYGHNAELLQTCRPLGEYSWLIDQIRAKTEELGIEAAIDQSLDIMPEDFEIKQILMEHRAEGARCPVDICYARTEMKWRKGDVSDGV